MEHEAGEKREPEKPDVWEPGLRLRLPPGAGEEEAGEGPVLAPPGWQPEEEVEPLPPSSLEPESGDTGRGGMRAEDLVAMLGSPRAPPVPLAPHPQLGRLPPRPPASAGHAAAPPAATSAVSFCVSSSFSCFSTAYPAAVRARVTPGFLSPVP